MRTTSYWLEEPRAQLVSPRREGRVQVAVIGGGVTGCSCALALAERGVRVRVHEAGEIAAGASGRNGGFALRGTAVPYEQARRDLGADRARLAMELSERALDRIEALAGDAFARPGSLRLAADEAELAALRREHDALLADGFAVEWLDELPPPLHRLYLGAIGHPRNGLLTPARWVRRLAGHAAAAGADIREHDAVEVGGVDADLVVVAGDGFIPGLLPELTPLVTTTRGQVLATEPLADRLYERPHSARAGFDYWHQRPDGRLVAGGSRDAAFAAERTVDDATTPLIQERIEALVERLLGHRPRVTHRWSGIWGETPDLLPLVGPVPGRGDVWVAGGYSGHGNVLGFACGELVARALCGEEPPELAIFDPERFAS